MERRTKTRTGSPKERTRASCVSFALAVLALVVATSGATAFAATKITTRDLANGAVTSPKIRDGGVHRADLGGGSVTGAKIADGTIHLGDLAPSAGPRRSTERRSTSTEW